METSQLADRKHAGLRTGAGLCAHDLVLVSTIRTALNSQVTRTDTKCVGHSALQISA
jgi:hypothetical protein